MNMQSIVGHKDVFLSYAHININFARKIKVISACDEVISACDEVISACDELK